MLYRVKFKHVYIHGNRIVEYKIYIDESEINDDLFDDPKELAVKYAMNKFFNDYVLLEGMSVEVLAIEKINERLIYGGAT